MDPLLVFHKPATHTYKIKNENESSKKKKRICFWLLLRFTIIETTWPLEITYVPSAFLGHVTNIQHLHLTSLDCPKRINQMVALPVYGGRNSPARGGGRRWRAGGESTIWAGKLDIGSRKPARAAWKPHVRSRRRFVFVLHYCLVHKWN